MAAFIRDRGARHRFRNKYKIRSKFRKLRDDNRKLFNDNKILFNENKVMRNELVNVRRDLAEIKNTLRVFNYERSYTFLVAPYEDAPPKDHSNDVFLAIACVAKNEGPYLKEWLEYHKLVGVERFYFYDNESEDGTRKILEPYINDGTVVYHYLPNHPITGKLPQVEANNDAIFKYRDKAKWMAIIDLDEFIVPVEKNTILEFLADYEGHPAVAINWICFDSNGHEKKPIDHGGLVTANYTRVCKDHNISKGHNMGSDRLCKCIVDPKRVVRYYIHYGRYYNNDTEVTEDFKTAPNGVTKSHSSKKIRINHYISKSREEYVNKITRNNKGNHNYYEINEDTINFPDETAQD